MIPIGDWAVKRLNRIAFSDTIRRRSHSGSPFARQNTHWLNKDKVYPDNVLYMATESHNRHHCAVFPKKLPTWFIQLFTQQQDIVLDPFIGSGTTALAASELARRFIGIDICPHYCELARNRLSSSHSIAATDESHALLDPFTE